MPSFDQALQILDVVCQELFVIEKDTSTVVDLIRAFERINNTWCANTTFSSEVKQQLKSIWKKRCNFCSHQQNVIFAGVLKTFLAFESSADLNFPQISTSDVELFSRWATSVLPNSKQNAFRDEASG